MSPWHRDSQSNNAGFTHKMEVPSLMLEDHTMHRPILLAAGCHDTAIKLWDTASGKEVRELKGHTKDVRGLAFAPDGKTLASGGMDGIIQLWDTATWEVRQTLKGHTAEINCVAYARDGNTLASGAWDKTVRLWDPVTGDARSVLEGHTEMVRDVVF